jgi:hypothetical protein
MSSRDIDALNEHMDLIPGVFGLRLLGFPLDCPTLDNLASAPHNTLSESKQWRRRGGDYFL